MSLLHRDVCIAEVVGGGVFLLQPEPRNVSNQRIGTCSAGRLGWRHLRFGIVRSTPNPLLPATDHNEKKQALVEMQLRSRKKVLQKWIISTGHVSICSLPSTFRTSLDQRRGICDFIRMAWCPGEWEATHSGHASHMYSNATTCPPLFSIPGTPEGSAGMPCWSVLPRARWGEVLMHTVSCCISHTEASLCQQRSEGLSQTIRNPAKKSILSLWEGKKERQSVDKEGKFLARRITQLPVPG